MRTLILITIVLLACSRSLQSGGGAVTLQVTPATVSPADSVVLTLRNGSRDAVGYNLCTSTLERQGSGGWEAVPADRICTMELRTLAPAGEATYGLEIPANLGAGEYRYRTGVEVMETGERTSVTSEPFRIS